MVFSANKLKWLTSKRIEQPIRSAQASLQIYRKMFVLYDEKLMHQEDKKNKKLPLAQKRGGIPYLAVESHSVSRRTLRHEVAAAWVDGNGLYQKGLAPKVKVKYPEST